jgi:hypothetical protein
MRCPDCNKFVGFDSDSEPEIDVSIDANGQITGSCRIVNTCAECGTELKEGNFEIEADACEAVKHHWLDLPEGPHSFDVEAEGSRTDFMKNTDRDGKPITSSRYMKHMYGAEVTLAVTCSCQPREADPPDDCVVV